MSRVLLADDDAGFRDALQTLLGEAGHSVRVVGNGLEALSAALDETPDVIVSDIHMPVLDGPDAISMLRAIPRFADIAVILMSGEAVSESVPTERFLHKPFEPSVLRGWRCASRPQSSARERIKRLVAMIAPLRPTRLPCCNGV